MKDRARQGLSVGFYLGHAVERFGCAHFWRGPEIWHTVACLPSVDSCQEDTVWFCSPSLCCLWRAFRLIFADSHIAVHPRRLRFSFVTTTVYLVFVLFAHLHQARDAMQTRCEIDLSVVWCSCRFLQRAASICPLILQYCVAGSVAEAVLSRLMFPIATVTYG